MKQTYLEKRITTTEKLDALAVSDYVINIAINTNRSINNIKLNKILYLLDIMYLDHYQKPLFDDQFVKWNYGPTLPNIYQEYQNNGSNAIIETGNHLVGIKEHDGIVDTFIYRDTDITKLILDYGQETHFIHKYTTLLSDIDQDQLIKYLTTEPQYKTLNINDVYNLNDGMQYYRQYPLLLELPKSSKTNHDNSEIEPDHLKPKMVKQLTKLAKKYGKNATFSIDFKNGEIQTIHKQN